jgi:hypothetical protein
MYTVPAPLPGIRDNLCRDKQLWRAIARHFDAVILIRLGHFVYLRRRHNVKKIGDQAAPPFTDAKWIIDAISLVSDHRFDHLKGIAG